MNQEGRNKEKRYRTRGTKYSNYGRGELPITYNKFPVIPVLGIYLNKPETVI